MDQGEVREWLVHRFGPVRDLNGQYMKLLEEVHELGQVIDGVQEPDDPGYQNEPDEGWYQNMMDEVADVVIVCHGIAIAGGFDLSDAVDNKWARRKTWVATEGET